jgi:hypothetical protein
MHITKILKENETAGAAEDEGKTVSPPFREMD